MKPIFANANDSELKFEDAVGDREPAISNPVLKRISQKKIHSRTQVRRRSAAAFTLVDAMMASGIMVIILAACLSAILVNQIATRKAKEEAIAMDFLTKYVESIKSLPFDSVALGQPISGLYNGVINIPPDTNWVSLNTVNYYYFHNELLWVTNRNPKLQFNMKQTSVSGMVHDKQINVKFDWDPPLKKGGQLEVQVDFLRTANVPTL